MTFYSNSWLPGAILLQKTEIYLILLFTFFISLLNFDFRNVNNQANSYFFLGDGKYFKLLLFFICISVIGFNLQEISSGFNLVYMSTFICYVYLFFFKLPSIFIARNELFLQFLRFISNLGFAIAFIGMVILVSGLSPIKRYDFTSQSIIVHPNFVAYFYTTAIITLTYYILASKNDFTLFEKYYRFASLAVLIIAQLFTYGRGGYVGTTVGISIIGTYYFRKRIILVLPFFISFLVFVIPSFFEAKGTSSFYSRFALLIPAYHMITASNTSLLWGYGAYHNMAIFVKYMAIDGVTEPNISDPHNTYLRLIMMFGLVFTSILILYVLKLNFRTLRASFRTTDINEKLFYGYLLALALGLLSMGLFDSGLVSTVFFYMHFLLVILGLMYYRTQKAVQT